MNGSYKMDDYILTKTYMYNYKDPEKWIKQAVSQDNMNKKFENHGVLFKTEMLINKESEVQYKLKVEVWKKVK